MVDYINYKNQPSATKITIYTCQLTMVSWTILLTFASLSIGALAQPVTEIVAKRDLSIQAAFELALKPLEISLTNSSLANDVTCIFDNFAGISSAPHTHGIEWWEDAQFLLNLILTSSVAEYAENKTTTIVDTLVYAVAVESSDLLGQIAGLLGLNGPLVAALGLLVETLLIQVITVVVKTIVATAEQVASATGTAIVVDSLINTALAIAEEVGFDLLILPIFPWGGALCLVGDVLFSGLTAFEACTFNVDIVSQILSEVRNVLATCS